MNQDEAKRKFRRVLRHFDLDDQVEKIEFCENKLNGALGLVDSVVEYRISLDTLLLTDPEELDIEWIHQMSHFPDGVVPSVPKEDRVFLVFLHEVAHIVNHLGIVDAPPKDSPEEVEREEEAWDFAWRVYRAYMAGQEQAD